MAKKVAVLAVNPVNGSGLFQYLEAFFENDIQYTTFAVAETTQISANSGIRLQTDDVVANLKGNESEYDALVFACGDAMPKFGENAGQSFNRDMMEVIKNFAGQGKILAGHCVAAFLFDSLGISNGKKVAVHPFVKPALKESIGTDERAVVEGNIYTAQNENAIPELLPFLIKALK
ncbi:MAG: DJ-1/PfpI family protein [Dysgonamonadaceae bacterium]|jgi:putative intracellular protease/amidase|nr:DJ-1/PfpI family protein [Dysgonamonadaceae bacterium]